ncbi:MAG: hypothetical protein V5A68_08360 [Candidatus Thermoplasmatota archaeon]
MELGISVALGFLSLISGSLIYFRYSTGKETDMKTKIQILLPILRYFI